MPGAVPVDSWRGSPLMMFNQGWLRRKQTQRRQRSQTHDGALDQSKSAHVMLFHSFPMTLSWVLLLLMGFTLSTGCAQTCLCVHTHFAHVKTFACMCANTHTHVHVHVCVCVCVHRHMCTQTHMLHVCLCVHTCVCMQTLAFPWTDMHKHTHTCVCVCVLLSNDLNFLPTCKNACHWEMGCKSWACNDCLGGFVDCLSVYFEKWISEFLINVLIQLLAGWKANLSKCTNRTMQMPRTAPKMPRSTGKLNILHD